MVPIQATSELDPMNRELDRVTSNHSGMIVLDNIFSAEEGETLKIRDEAVPAEEEPSESIVPPQNLDSLQEDEPSLGRAQFVARQALSEGEDEIEHVQAEEAEEEN